MTARTVFLASILVMTLPASAESIDNAIYKSNCGPGDPSLGYRYYKSLPMLSELETKIKAQPEYSKLESQFAKQTAFQFTRFTFKVTPEGDIICPKVESPSGSSSFDKQFLSVLKKVGKLSAPVNSLPIERGIEIALAKFTVENRTYVCLHRGIVQRSLNSTELNLDKLHSWSLATFKSVVGTEEGRVAVADLLVASQFKICELSKECYAAERFLKLPPGNSPTFEPNSLRGANRNRICLGLENGSVEPAFALIDVYDYQIRDFTSRIANCRKIAAERGETQELENIIFEH